MKKYNKGITALILGACLSLGGVINAFAATDAYLVKDTSTGIVYEYNKTVLNNALVNYTMTGADAYYQEFDGKRVKYSIYAFHSDKSKYVDFKVASDALIEYTLTGKNFDLDTFMDLTATPALTITSQMKSVIYTNGQVTYVDKQTQTDTLEVLSIE